MTLYPWFDETARQFLAHRAQMPHAWLLSGAAGIGKFELGDFLAASLLCEQPQPEGLACGHCPACQWFARGNHPDVRYIYPLQRHEELFPDRPLPEGNEKSQEIRIEQFRALDDWFHASTHRGGYRVVLIYPAQQMNRVVANALLKVLEEPATQTVFLLITSQLPELLPTIRSRCRLLNLPAPDNQQATQWLQQQGIAPAEDWLRANDGAPLLALKAARTHEQAVPDWLTQLSMALVQRQKAQLYALLPSLEDLPFGELLRVIQRFNLDIQLQQYGLEPRHYPGLEDSIQQLAQRSSPQVSTHLCKTLLQRQATAEHPFNAKLRVHHLLDNLGQVYT